MNNRYVYHYCAHYQIITGQISYIDGIALLEKRITSHEDLREFKKSVSPEHFDKLTVGSLSFIGMEK